MTVVTVAIPVLNGGSQLVDALAAVRRQTVEAEVELLICDSGSTDGSLDAAREAGARVLEIPRASFSHGGTRNRLMAEARGTHVAFLTQDAEPARDDWLATLLGALVAVPDAGLACGPYVARPGASVPVARELHDWFASLAGPDGGPRVDRLAGDAPADDAALLGPVGFFTDANGMVARAAWERVPFRDVPYAEDQRLALDMLRAGFAKVFVPGAPVLHSHDYRPGQLWRRAFDEWRGLREVYGFREPLSPASVRRNVLGPWRADRRWAAAHGGGSVALTSARHHLLRYGGALLGSRADRLPARLRGRISLEGRATFLPAERSSPT